MKKYKRAFPAILYLVGIVLAASGCEGISGHDGVMEILKSANTPLEKTDPTFEIPPEPLVLVNTKYPGGHFYTQTRKDKMERYRCSSCHTGTDTPVNEAREAVHGNIKLNHGAVDDPDACDTCHNIEDRDYLVTENVVKVDFDHSYEMCGNCHFRQKKDWVGGAHGKRIQNWEGQRVVYSCASCHNPHSPRFAKRWPTTFAPPDPVLAESSD